ncbi:hypothetical protein D0Y65_018032, partial [Glycine soja]
MVEIISDANLKDEGNIDKMSELKNLSELKQCCLKKQFDPSPKTAILEAKSKELEKLEEANRQNKAIENRLNQSGQLSILDNLHITRLSPSHKRTREKGDIKEFRRLVLGEFFLEKGEGNEKGKGCKFSNVYMESVIDEIFLYSKVESDPQVAFTVVPGFRIGKTVLQCQVYLSQHQTKVKKNQFNKAK